MFFGLFKRRLRVLPIGGNFDENLRIKLSDVARICKVRATILPFNKEELIEIVNRSDNFFELKGFRDFILGKSDDFATTLPRLNLIAIYLNEIVKSHFLPVFVHEVGHIFTERQCAESVDEYRNAFCLVKYPELSIKHPKASEMRIISDSARFLLHTIPSDYLADCWGFSISDQFKDEHAQFHRKISGEQLLSASIENALKIIPDKETVSTLPFIGTFTFANLYQKLFRKVNIDLYPNYEQLFSRLDNKFGKLCYKWGSDLSEQLLNHNFRGYYELLDRLIGDFLPASIPWDIAFDAYLQLGQIQFHNHNEKSLPLLKNKLTEEIRRELSRV